jgi:hypothetical protein
MELKGWMRRVGGFDYAGATARNPSLAAKRLVGLKTRF